MPLPILTSAPGKVILFGEHAAVYGEPAIAAAVSSLRTYLLVSNANDPNIIQLDFLDIKLTHQWECNDFSTIPTIQPSTKELDSTLLKSIDPLLSSFKSNPLHHQAALTFLYLFFSLIPNLKGLKFSVRSTLPVGAGLGSSASICVSLSTALLHLAKLISIPLNKAQLKLINDWAFIGEKCMHGNPSGIDNTVATYGNSILLNSQSHEIIDIDLPILLTYTKIPRSTKQLVSNVRHMYNSHHAIVSKILSSIGHITLESKDLLLADASDIDSLGELININQHLLQSINVSHPMIEKIIKLTNQFQIGYTKLTGAGGGGCTLTLLKKDVDRKDVDRFINILKKDYNFDVFETNLGGFGTGVLELDNKNKELDDRVKQCFEIKSLASREQLDQILLPLCNNTTLN
ncbi:hypothetical protein TBLA_0D01180 [Henningerozyma blattae CBS 6284]|uniref:Mevalonate kinase n=1 Tax=Henningerozyma blattae (strain ATCC 34711 / CBS 6284 / DSM 70876 / NBRC 10599 / NRRL Y-10934 / UCD 77-7) TaxID=1071380 RepID=I2H2M4_HENB6|nr:hypothetical protein TBLA_0D01180 [Tetrapisispora blattae CBS 6284]CCH60626.1 hypothetical protein TBLA_0D01180 [Tetrapisispora blattae CBS 6284]